MEIGDKNIEKDKGKKPGYNTQAFKHAISMIESSGGKFLDNPNSSAAGRYHFLYNLIKKDPDMKGISKRDFINNTDLQERIMDKALNGKLSGYTYGFDYAKRLKDEFGSDHEIEDLTALVHFLGPGNTRKYLKNPNSFTVPGKVNASAQQYVDNFRKHFDKYKEENLKEGKHFKRLSSTPINTEKAQAVVKKDKTAIAQPQFKDPKRVNLKENLVNMTEGFDFINNEFKEGGQMGGLTGADQLVTLFENGGSHEQNPLGGIPQGIGANGKPNLVEEGETKWNDYIFSNSFSLDGTYTGDDGVSSNVFENGGELTNPKNKNTEKPPTNPITDSIFNPVQKKEPLEFTKSERQPNAYGGLDVVSETFQVPDVREDFMSKNMVTTVPDDTVHFDRAVKDESAKEFLNRYNDPWTRKTMKEQTQLSDEDIDNMILKGLNVKKEIGGNVAGSKASFDSDSNTLHMGHDHDEDKGVETHERVHGSLFDAAQGDNLMNILGNPFQQETKSLMKKMSPDTLRYLGKPHEAYGNFTEFREKLGLKPGEQIDAEEMNKRIKAKGLTNENFIRVFDDDKVVEALNTIAYQDNNIDNYTLA